MKLIYTITSIVISLTILMACSAGGNSSNKRIKNLDNVKPGGDFINIPLTIVDRNFENNYWKFRVQALHQNDTLEMLIGLKNGIPAGFVNGVPKNMFVSDGITFESVGKKSDNLLNSLNSWYELPKEKLKLKDTQTFSIANLNQKAMDYGFGVGRFKIFLEKEEDIAELFVNFNMMKKEITLAEKDPGYRESLIKLLKK